MNEKGELRLFAWFAVFAVACIIGQITAGIARTTPTPYKDKNLLLEGDIQGAMAQAHELLTAMRSADWDYSRVDRSLLTLPDQIFAENPRHRDPHYFSFIPMTRDDVSGHTASDAVYDQVAFYSFLYVRMNLRVVKGREGTTHPEGFVIVGWKDGRVTQAPIGDVRLLPSPTEPDAWLFVWPGLDTYDPSLRKYVQE